MERLTKLNKELGWVVGEEDVIEYALSDKENVHFGNAIDRLAEYEDGEKQGLLKWLPCKIGDTIYTIEPRFYNYSYHEGVQKGKVIGFECENSGRWVFWVRMADDNKNSANAYEFDNVGKTVFFMQKEAEQALAKMKGV